MGANIGVRRGKLSCCRWLDGATLQDSSFRSWGPLLCFPLLLSPALFFLDTGLPQTAPSGPEVLPSRPEDVQHGGGGRRTTACCWGFPVACQVTPALGGLPGSEAWCEGSPCWSRPPRSPCRGALAGWLSLAGSQPGPPRREGCCGGGARGACGAWMRRAPSIRPSFPTTGTSLRRLSSWPMP